jgi:hypothetical protein
MRTLSLQELNTVSGAGTATNMVDGALLGAGFGLLIGLTASSAEAALTFIAVGTSLGAVIPMLYGIAHFADTYPGFAQ